MEESEFNVDIKVLIDEDKEVDADTLSDLLEGLDSYGAVGSYGPGFYTVGMTIEAEDMGEASEIAGHELVSFAEKVGLTGPIVRFEVTTMGELEAELAQPSHPSVLGIAELAGMLDVSRQRASQIARTAAFPKPYAELASGPIWFEQNVRRFVEKWERKPGRPRKRAGEVISFPAGEPRSGVGHDRR